MKQTQYSNFLPIIIAVLCGLKSYASAEAPKTFRVNDLTFERPEAWNWERPHHKCVKPTLRTRKGWCGRCSFLLLWSWGRWWRSGKRGPLDGQFQNVSGKKTESKIGGIPITFVQASGTFLSAPFRPKSAQGRLCPTRCYHRCQRRSNLHQDDRPKKTVEKAAPTSWRWPRSL